ncbi:hypothetical protein GWI33_002295, partial [Rhynchophorus ferrugineus]
CDILWLRINNWEKTSTIAVNWLVKTFEPYYPISKCRALLWPVDLLEGALRLAMEAVEPLNYKRMPLIWSVWEAIGSVPRSLYIPYHQIPDNVVVSSTSEINRQIPKYKRQPPYHEVGRIPS